MQVILRRALIFVLILVATLARAGTDYADFLNALAKRESSLNRTAENTQTHYIGLFQFGEAALKDIGIYSGDSTRTNDWTGTWSGKYGATSKGAFMASGDAQLSAIADYQKLTWNSYLKGNGAEAYLGRTINGVVVTESGLIAASHLVGAGAVLAWLRSNGATNPTDASGTQMTEYMSAFGGYNVASFVAPTYSEFASASPTGGSSTIIGSSSGATGGRTPGSGSAYADAGDGFAGGSGVNMSAIKQVIIGLIASLVLAWAGYIVLGCYGGYTAGRLTLSDLKSYVIQGFLVMAIILWLMS